MRPTASFFPKTSSTECTDPSRAEMKMKSTANQLLRRKGGIQQRIFLQKLTKRGIGTFKAEIVARSVAKDCCFRNKEHVRRKILNYTMKAKVEDAEVRCKFFLTSVNFYRFNTKNWHFRQILREKVAFFYRFNAKNWRFSV